MKTVFVPMTDKNIQKILNGIKTSTLRSSSAAKKIGLKENETALCFFKGIKHQIKNMGLLTVDEAGGYDHVWITEGFLDQGPMFDSTKKWLKGEGKLYFYTIKKLPVSK